MPITIKLARRAGDRTAHQVVPDLLSGKKRKALWPLWFLAALLPAQAQEVYYIHTDALGSPVAETDANRNVVRRYEYEPYGRRLNGSNDDKPGYTGHVMDAVTGLVQMQQRYYDPMLGVMLSVDPVAAYEQPITNFCRYCYANNNPYRFTDPDGRQAKELGRWVRALWDNDGDFEKAKAQVDRQHEMDRKVVDTVVDFTAGGIVKDAVEVTIKVSEGIDPTGQGVGAIAGEVAGRATEAVLDGKIGSDAAAVVGASVGKATGDTVERAVDSSRGGSSNGSSSSPIAPRAEPKPPEPRPYMRDKIGDK